LADFSLADRNLLVHYRVKDHQKKVTSNYRYPCREAVMSHETESTPHSPIDGHVGPQPMTTAPAELSTMPSLAADRLYQFAALTAGLFFLATLL
jgi:hypothetical protein